MRRAAVVGVLLLMMISARSAKIRSCETDPVTADIQAARYQIDARKHPQLSARLRVLLRPDRSVGKISVVQSTGNREIDATLLKEFGEWTFLKAKDCDVLFIPITLLVKPQKT
jgi:outer membrane biosynthesis protein TonB